MRIASFVFLYVQDRIWKSAAREIFFYASYQGRNPE